MIYELNGKTYEFPEGMSDDEALSLMQQDQAEVSNPATGGGMTPFQPPAESIDPSTLASNKDWLAASKILFEYNEGRKWGEQLPDRKMGGGRGGTVNVSDPYAGFSDQQLADYGLEAMGWFNYNMIQMGVDAAQVQYAPDDFKQSFLYLMDSYDNLEMSLGGTWRLIKGAAVDPTTYAGLGSFGIGTAVSQGGKIATKEGLKELLKQGVKRSVVLGVEGMAYGSAISVAHQSVEVSAGAKEAISLTEVLTGAAIGGAAAVGLGTVARVGGAYLGKAVNKVLGKDVLPTAPAASTELPPPAAPPLSIDRSITPGQSKTGPDGLLLLHGTPNQSLSLDQIAIIRQSGQKQGKKGRIYGGFYTTAATDISQAVKYANADGVTGSIFDVIIKPDVKIFHKEGDITRLSESYISGLKDQGYGIVVGKDVRGNVEYAVIDKDAISALNPSTVTPNASTVAPTPSAEPSLPGNLAGAKPRYNYGQKGFGLAFESDVEKALFITSQAKKSARDADYRNWLKSTGLTDEQIDIYGKTVRDHIKGLAKDSNDPELSIVKLAPRKEVTPSAPVEPTIRQTPARPEMTNVDSKVPTTAQDVVAAIKDAAPDMSVGNIPSKRTDLFKAAENTYNALRNMGVRSAQDALDLFTKVGLSQDQQTIIKVAVQQAAEHATVARSEFLKVKNAVSSTADEVSQAAKALEKIGPVQAILSELDKSISSPSGRDLGSRVGGMLTNERRGLSVETILKENKIDINDATVEELTAAENELIRRVDNFIEKARADREIIAIEQKAQAAHAAGNITEAANLLAERDALLTVKAQKEAAQAGTAKNAYDAINNGVIAKLNEFIISTVFTPATLVVNGVPAIVKTIAYPAVRSVIRGVGRGARAEAFHTYSTMLSHSGAAFRAARLAFKYEQALLTGEFNKVLERAPAIKGMKGRVLRTFPRLLNATDEFFSQIHYRGFLAGETAFQATERGKAKGLKGDALHAFVKAEVDKTVKQAYEIAPNTVDVIDMLRIKGTQRGLKGDALGFWIKSELDKNGDLFKRATNQAGKNYANDVLFKREFSKTNVASRVAAHYEHFVNTNPIMRIVGQLFFRTPVRVFEEGIRLTPGFQFLAPKFIGDLRGSNGLNAQIRAQGEAMLSYGITAGVIGMYSTGMITGSGPTDYKQRRILEDTGWQPYSIRMSDGSWWSYRNMDPFATPIKIMVNLMDRMNELEYRRSQGEKTEGHTAHLQQYFGVATGSMVQAIRDASLTTGFDQAMDIVDALTQEDDTTMGDQLAQWFGKKAQMLVPAMYSKTKNILNPTMRDPLTLDQYIMAKIDGEVGKVPAMYDVLGRPRTSPNPYSSFLFPVPTSKEMMDDGASEQEQVVLQGLSDLAIANDTNFTFPYKMPGFDFDMRRRMTTDGQETVYDRVIRRYRELNPSQGLYPLFAEGGLGGMGTKGSNGSRLIAANKIINAYRKAAFAKILSEELNLKEEFIQNKMDAAEAQAGTRDSALIPFR